MDLDNDGYNDILSGSYSRMDQPMAGLFQVLWGQDDSTFAEATPLSGTDDEVLEIPVPNDEEKSMVSLATICTRPIAVDWDGDGDLDLVVGNFGGTFYLFLGEGNGKFLPTPERMMAGDEPLQISGHHSDPFVIDWDGDGDLDVLSGSSNGGVQWAENVADAGELQQLAQLGSLIET